MIAAISETTNTPLPKELLFIEINASNIITQVSKAVINGAKLAYPNGIKLKYENVSLTLSVGDGENTNTAPKGSISKTIVMIGNGINLIFFIAIPPRSLICLNL